MPLTKANPLLGVIASAVTGSASASVFTTSGDTNTGIFFPASDTTAFATNAIERLRIDSSGNVGIGSPAPGLKLSIKVADASLSDGITLVNDTGAGGDATGVLISASLGASGSKYQSAAIRMTQAGGFGGTMFFATNDDNVGNAIDRMTILKSGSVGIGTTAPSAQLELSTDSAKKPSTNTWTIASDERLKTNITTADNDRCYEIVKQVALKRYTWKSEVYSQDQVKDRSKLGWIAQDVEAVFPKAVGTNRFSYNQVFEDVVVPELDSEGNAVLDENGVAKTKTEKRLVSEEVIEDCKDLNSDQIYAAMYGTIQKLIEKVETLEAKVVALEAT